MRSPFPGMDPYLEGYLWPDLHQSLAHIIKVQLIPQVRPQYLVRTNTYIIADEGMQEDIGIMYPDVEVLQKNQTLKEPAIAYGTTKRKEITPPTILIPAIPFVEVRIPVVELRDKKDNRLVTAIEILSPVNKRYPGLTSYRKKRKEMYKLGVHFIEIDLLRRGTKPLNNINVPNTHYSVSLVRANQKETAIWAFNVNQTFPIIPVPLNPNDADTVLDLGEAFQLAYAQNAYQDAINYNELPPPPKFEQKYTSFMKECLVSFGE